MLDMLALGLIGAAVNHARGGGFGASLLPGHARFYAAPAMGLASFPFVGPLDGFLVALCFLVWSLAPWGRWYDLGRLSPTYVDREETWFEAAVMRVAGNDHIAFTVRNLVCLLPAAILLSPLFLLLAPAMTLAYEVAWRATPSAPIRTGELITGAMWGALIAWSL